MYSNDTLNVDVHILLSTYCLPFVSSSVPAVLLLLVSCSDTLSLASADFNEPDTETFNSTCGSSSLIIITIIIIIIVNVHVHVHICHTYE